jgi:hypothetical protein
MIVGRIWHQSPTIMEWRWELGVPGALSGMEWRWELGRAGRARWAGRVSGGRGTG